MSGQFGVWWHPPASQVSVVQAMPSSQLRAGPPTQLPPLLLSAAAGLRLSSVQALRSSQLFATLPTQVPPLHTSVVVHGLPSLHGALLLVWTQPPATAGLQLSSVQTLLSSQFFAPLPTHVPPLQTSVVVHGLPSLHGALLLVGTQRPPPAGSHRRSVQTVLSSKFFASLPTHVPPLPTSVVALALHAALPILLLVWTQPPATAGLQLSSVQTLLSSQFFAPLPTHVPPLQTSVVVHGLPSSHGLLLF